MLLLTSRPLGDALGDTSLSDASLKDNVNSADPGIGRSGRPGSADDQIRRRPPRRHIAVRAAVVLAIACRGLLTAESDAQQPQILNLWPETPPGLPAVTDGDEADRTRDGDQLIAGRRVARIGNVATPRMHVHLPPPDQATGAACLVCPGGGFSILAWDLEGTEVADWLTSQGIAAVIVRYRVPTRQHGWPGLLEGPVMDTQRALSLTRQNAQEWGIDPERIGVLGFSAGGATAAMTALQAGRRTYDAVDAADTFACDADFAVLIYPGAIVDDDGALRPQYTVTPETPPMLFIHAADDPVDCNHSIVLFQALRAAGRSAELHVFHRGGHGYGLRSTQDAVTGWPQRTHAWLAEHGLLSSQPDE